MSVGPYGVWGVNKLGNIYKKTSTGWQHVPGVLFDISVGQNSVWGVSSNGHVYRRVGAATSWEQIHIEGGLKQVGEIFSSCSKVKLLPRFLLAKCLTQWCGGQIKMMKYMCGREGTGGYRYQAVSGLFPVERLEFGALTRMAGSITGKELVEERLRKCQRGKCTLYLLLQTLASLQPDFKQCR